MSINKMYQVIQDILEEENWGWIENSEGDITIEWYSPAGEDFLMELDKENPAIDFIAQAKDFDIDEHVMLWAENRGENGIPSTIEELLEDAKAIKEELEKIIKLINKYNI